jgi:hypothetical protein
VVALSATQIEKSRVLDEIEKLYIFTFFYVILCYYVGRDFASIMLSTHLELLAMNKSTNPVILSVVHRRQNPLDSTCIICVKDNNYCVSGH